MLATDGALLVLRGSARNAKSTHRASIEPLITMFYTSPTNSQHKSTIHVLTSKYIYLLPIAYPIKSKESASSTLPFILP
eukprot:CCRYP_003932-RA/>CCRYP_003932-RA protein AED:0.17 eAED:0.17 QI:0/0.66/0.71/1/0.33/0/7/4226/78